MILLIRNSVLIIWCIVLAIPACLLMLLRPGNPSNSGPLCRTFGSIGLLLMNIRVEVEGREKLDNDHPFIIIANHQHNWDVIAFSSFLSERTVTIGKKSLQWIPFFGQMYILAGHILIDRSNKKKAYSVMDETAKKIVDNDTSIFIFPEGTRNPKPGLLPFKRGAFYTAIKAQRPIIPMVAGEYHHLNFNSPRRQTIKVKVLDPIPTKGLKENDWHQLRDKCYQLMKDAVDELAPPT